MSSVERRLARRHRGVQEEVLVAGGEGEDPCALARSEIQRGELRREGLDEERRGGAVAVVALVAHLHRLTDERAQVDAAETTHRLAERRAEDVPEPAQPLEDLGSVGAVAQDLAEALVQRGVRAVARGTILHDEHGHRCRHHAGHRADGGVVMAGIEAGGAA